MKIVLKNVCCILLLAGFFWLSGCRARTRITPPVQPEVRPQIKKILIKEKRLARTAYTVQVGAFSILSNAIRLSQILSLKGLDAFYFRHESGLYKVCFGDFPSRDAALQKAECLLSEAVIEDYFIVRPEDYAVSKQNTFGEAYLRDQLAATAESFIGVEYSWGGTSREDGFDCSGLTLAVYQLNGLNLPRSSKEQYEAGRTVAQDQLKKGDLVFFITSQSQKISHVGIYIGKKAFIHAPGKDKEIRKESLDDAYFRNRFAGACTYLK